MCRLAQIYVFTDKAKYIVDTPAITETKNAHVRSGPTGDVVVFC